MQQIKRKLKASRKGGCAAKLSPTHLRQSAEAIHNTRSIHRAVDTTIIYSLALRRLSKKRLHGCCFFIRVGGKTDTSQGVGPVRGSRALSRPPTDRPPRPPHSLYSRITLLGPRRRRAARARRVIYVRHIHEYLVGEGGRKKEKEQNKPKSKQPKGLKKTQRSANRSQINDQRVSGQSDLMVLGWRPMRGAPR